MLGGTPERGSPVCASAFICLRRSSSALAAASWLRFSALRVRARDAAAMAAMQRANNAGGTERDRKMAERRQKDELVGKILAHYQARGQDPPSGLPAADGETLRKHLAHVKKEAAAATGSTARPPQIAL